MSKTRPCNIGFIFSSIKLDFNLRMTLIIKSNSGETTSNQERIGTLLYLSTNQLYLAGNNISVSALVLICRLPS